MKDLTKEYEEIFRDLGLKLGHKLAELIAKDPGESVALVEKTIAVGQEAIAKAVKESTSGPKILPGLAGRRRKPGEPPPPCGKQGCTKPSRTRGYCQTHYVQWLKAGKS